MYVRKVMPVYSTVESHGRASAMRPFSFFLGASRSRRRRFFTVLLAATALAATGASLIPRLLQPPVQDAATRPPAPAEPGLFEFPQARQSVPAAPVPEPAALQAKDEAAAKPRPLPRTAPAPTQTALPGGVERFDSCAPACDSRDPALTGGRAASATATNGPGTPPAPLRVSADAPRPPRGVGEGVPAQPEPGLVERTLTATRTAVSDMTDGVKGALGIKW